MMLFGHMQIYGCVFVAVSAYRVTTSTLRCRKKRGKEGCADEDVSRMRIDLF